MSEGNSFGNFPEYQAPPSRKGSVILRNIKKFWYIPVIVVVLIVVAAFIQIRSASAENSWKRAEGYFAKADYDKAAKELEGKDVPNDAQRLTVYSQTMLATRKLDPALTGYERLYKLKKDPATKIIIGNIYNEQKSYDKAAKIYQEVISTNPTYVQAYVNLSTLHKVQGNKEQAIEVAEKGVANNSKSVVMHELLVSMLLEQRDSKKFTEAVENLKKLNPSDPLIESLKM